MNQSSRRYFILNKNSDFKRGYLQGISLNEKRLKIINGGNGSSFFLSRIFDSGENGMQWHRFRLRCTDDDASGRLIVYASESVFIDTENAEEQISIEECIQSESIALSDKLSLMEPYKVKEYPYFEDVLLHEIRGRYLWFLLEIYPNDERIELWDITLFFPGKSWIDTLPEIFYQSDRDGFLERYLGIFQSMYEDMEDRISNVPNLLDVDRADGEFLSWMAGWLDIEEHYRWSNSKLRALIKSSFMLYRKRGTREGILDFIEHFTGEKPIIVEWGQYNLLKHDEKLYRDDPYQIMIFVREEVLYQEKDRQTLVRIIEDVIPVHMYLKLVILKPYMFLDNHTYIGINSKIGRYKEGQLDGNLALSFSTMS